MQGERDMDWLSVLGTNTMDTVIVSSKKHIDTSGKANSFLKTIYIIPKKLFIYETAEIYVGKGVPKETSESRYFSGQRPN